jgi:hypothetical protein
LRARPKLMVECRNSRERASDQECAKGGFRLAYVVKLPCERLTHR